MKRKSSNSKKKGSEKKGTAEAPSKRPMQEKERALK
jgi:hypothetical protein